MVDGASVLDGAQLVVEHVCARGPELDGRGHGSR
jgi:hypothetical protein